MLRSFVRGHPVDYIDHQGCQLTFRSPRDLGEGEQRVKLASQTLSVQVESVRAVSGGYVCHGRVQGDWRVLETLPAQSSGPPLRKRPRLPCRIRVMGRELPAYRGMTVDFSVQGMQVELEGPLEVGKVVKVRLDFEIPALQSTHCTARVAWCRRDQARLFRAGMEFLEPSTALEDFQNWLLDPKAKVGHQPAPVELSRPASPGPRPPAGRIEELETTQGEARLVVAHLEGGRHQLRFSKPRILRDNRGATGKTYFDAVEFEQSELITAVQRRGPILLDNPPEFYHYQFLSQTDEVVFEVVCEGPASARSTSAGHESRAHG